MTMTASSLRWAVLFVLSTALLLGCDTTNTPTNSRPTATFETEATSFSVELDASDSSPSGDGDLTYEWDLGDGTEAEGSTVSHEYEATGEYRITLTVTDDRGSQATATEFFTVENRTVTYDLDNLPDGVSDDVEGTVTFTEVTASQTLVTLELSGPTGLSSVSHPAHIHAGSREDAPGAIRIFLTPLDGNSPGNEDNPTQSAKLVDRPFDEMAEFDGYVNVHESNAALQNVVFQGNIGANASDDITTTGTTTDVISDGRARVYDIEAQSNGGALPMGIDGTVEFIELTSGSTLVLTELESATGANTVSHPVHIHDGPSQTAPGAIQVFLAPIDGNVPGTDANPARSGQVVALSYDELVEFNGYVNVHESNANLQNVVSQGNIGTNANGRAGEGF